jgi:hypothetical protein
MEKEIEYVEDKVFKKMTKKEKLSMPSHFGKIEVKSVLVIPIRQKMSGYHMASFFGKTEKGWVRVHDYDCWSITSDEVGEEIISRYSLLRGDFEHGGFHIFSIIDEHHTAFLDYAGQISVKKKTNHE